ncbi:MAG: hydroxymethylglutaryl-CoA lyase [Sphingomonadaceae bacterium]|uniref:hydroxymethylglutaryl-CoA lyase n=1 Tax=Thermaurantiacus sp. TaxID=2820283 RepID=UPI00298F012F|nr:hydroxymethylglutaryl-CoA lyase [Thermaurantiacus sp.]MCS6986649.1 hydroxymethylglutaryl-CoA lyase [Sphingomonadaceae bacterium]MDW8414089.1 hydroxymethylglutaryl-CoA lyase [Thermaurantiacus sp.]
MNLWDGVDVLVSEVGPRDGLQSITPIMPTEAKLRWIGALVEAGVREVEAGSFVPAHVVPQLADTAEVVRTLKRCHPGLHVAALVPNARGARAALEAGADKITLPLSASETHSLRNLRRTHAQVLDEVRAIAELLSRAGPNRPVFEGAVSTAFGCTLEGPVPEARVVALAERLVALGCDEVSLSDTTGYANPAQVRRLVKAVQAAVGPERMTGLHLHNTRGLGLANVLAGLEEGVRTFDASQGGLGGCPFAPGASGNVVTEDLVFMLEAMGLKTGIDLDRLLAARRILAEALPTEPLYGFLAEAGLPLGFRQAA